jgi:hypothetical protein
MIIHFFVALFNKYFFLNLKFSFKIISNMINGFIVTMDFNVTMQTQEFIDEI